ncbi:hypothetical protein [Streptomyces chartreusis]|uniref:hypothetical protein n=1 Tax=Streptomyces chartreusis TaxID=1969 RepID=UPI00123E0586|nr:hypothetical protein [Streptomyces chartreusis]QEV71991.1 hypothetical protein CP983_38655 [Streptomyces chartreusis]GGX21763.1 hypothetical protein GCM10010321_40260 [Streptomyces chartreusis]
MIALNGELTAPSGPTLDDEIANVTRVSAAAGIYARLTSAPGAVAAELTDPARHRLGLVRHSRAGHAEVEYRVADGLARLR